MYEFVGYWVGEGREAARGRGTGKGAGPGEDGLT